MTRVSLPLAALLAGALALAGCITAPEAETPSQNHEGPLAPEVPELPELITKLALTGSLEIGGANDLVFRDHYAYVSAGSGTYVVDITNHTAPVQVSMVECKGKDIGVVDLPTGRRILTVSWQADDGCPGAAPAGGIRLVDVTDPAAPVVLPQVPLRFGSHTNSPYGDTGIVYNSAYNLNNPFDHHRAEIVDITTPEEPKVAGELMFPLVGSTSPGCHDILTEPQYHRAVCAGITETMIWDTTDPLAPKITDYLVNPLINIHHSAVSTHNGTLLVIGDEFAGALGPGCNGPAPTGAVWFYGIDGYRFTEMLGYFPPPANPGKTPCTAHNFNVVEGKDLLVSAFYTSGTMLIDFSDPGAPKLVDQQVPEGTVAWAAYYYNGAVYTGDSGRGLDVFLLE
ncbi:MAG TPA: hypothetical protein VNZ52_04650 [Candidatus Thermoplasmatota archaeon]|nr:hypothetical protein [Candidatus Thermoplasmatota archaeon]